MKQEPTLDRFLALLGAFPDKAPLELQVLSERDLEGHTLKLVEYATVHDKRVQAYLLLPHGRAGRKPGILAIHSVRSHLKPAP